MKALYKTTIAIWSEDNPTGWEITDLAEEATDGTMYCSVQRSRLVVDPKADPDYASDFFDVEEEDDE